MSKQIVITRQYDPDGGPPTTGQHISPYSNRYNSNQNFVAPIAQPSRRQPMQAIPVDVNYEIAVPLQSTQHVEMRTTAVDRAHGFAIRTRQLGLIIGLAITVAAIVLVKVPILSFWSLAIYVMTYATVWLWAYYLDLKHSPEGIARNESDRKWDVIERHQARMWDHYDRLITGNNND